MHPNSGRKQSPEHIRKRIESRRKNGTYVFSEEHKEKLRKARLGKKHTDEWKRMMSNKMMGRISPMKGKTHTKKWRELMRKKMLGRDAWWMKGTHLSEETKQKLRDRPKGKNIVNWKGDFAGYSAMHYWVAREKGKPKHCEHCKRTDKKKYEWANKDHRYARNTDDYIRLCTSCHRIYDNENNLFITI